MTQTHAQPATTDEPCMAVFLPESLYARVRDHAHHDGVPVPDYVASVLTAYLDVETEPPTEVPA